jgi:hypothetical protein
MSHRNFRSFNLWRESVRSNELTCRRVTKTKTNEYWQAYREDGHIVGFFNTGLKAGSLDLTKATALSRVAVLRKKLRSGTKVTLRANKKENWPQEFGVVWAFDDEQPDTIIVKVEPHDSRDDGLREVTLDQVKCIGWTR